MEQLVPHIPELSEQKKTLQVQISELEEKKKKVVQQTNEIPAKVNITESTLEEYRTTKEELEGHGAGFEQINQQFRTEHKQLQLDFKQFRDMVIGNNQENHEDSHEQKGNTTIPEYSTICTKSTWAAT